jgi:hypothetical protein
VILADVAIAPLTVVPAWRLGGLLKSARETAGTSLDDLSARSGRYPVEELEAIEAGDRPLDDHEVDRILGLYGVEHDSLVPDRDELVIDLDHRELAAAGHTQALAGSAPSPEEVLGTYLTLVYTLRSAEPGTPVRLRQADVDVLARALALAVPDVEQRLEGLMADPQRVVLQQRSKLLRSRVLVPAAGVLVAVCVGGALVVWSRSSSEPARSSTSTTTVVQGTGNGVSTTVPPTSAPTTTEPNAPATVQGNGLRHDQIPPGAVGLAPAQVVTRGGNGQPVQSNRGATSTTSTTLAG